MKRPLLSRLRRNGVYYLVGALLLLLGVPLYQFLLLVPQGYSAVLANTDSGHFTAYLLWLSSHTVQFIGYRTLLVIAPALLISLPFTLFRIIVAQEILEGEEEQEEAEETPQQEGEADERKDEVTEAPETEEEAMPEYAWRGKGYAVIAAWGGLFGIILYVLGTLAGTIYLASTALTFTIHTPVPDNFAALTGTFAILTNTAGGGLLALSCLFFGAVIARRGRNLWPGIWVAFAYMALAAAALFSGNAVAVAGAPAAGQAALTTPTILLFALWVLWLGVMLVRLKPE